VWAVVGYGMFVGMFAGLLGLPDWTLDVSPFATVPMLPAEPWSAPPVLGMLLAAGALVWLGMVGLARRDLAAV
jgi:ABC-2 type transport system permease protein